MTLTAALGAAATMVSAAFALCTWERYRARGRVHELAWTMSLVLFALASLAYWSAGAIGWNEWNFRAFYLFGAILNVPYLAVGTIALLGGAPLGRRVLTLLHPVAGVCAGVMLAAPLAHPIPARGMPEGRHVFGLGPRIMAGVGSGVAATILIVGALWSAVNLVVAHRRPARGDAPAIAAPRLAATNVLIALGSIVLSLGGTFATGSDLEHAFGVCLVSGIVVLFAGFLVSSPGPAANRRPSGVTVSAGRA